MEIQVTGPKVFFELPFDLPDSTIFTMKNLITQTTITLFFTTIVLILLAYFLTRKISKRPGKIQVLLEKVITMLYNMVDNVPNTTRGIPAVSFTISISPKPAPRMMRITLSA